MERKIVYFEKPGPANTEATLRLAADEAAARGIRKVVLASTRGDTAKRAAALFAGTGVRLIVVPHQYGFTEVLCKPLQARSWGRGTSPYDVVERSRRARDV